MASVAGHLSVAALEDRNEACEDVMSSRHFHSIWLLANGHSTGVVAPIVFRLGSTPSERHKRRHKFCPTHASMCRAVAH
jgi:hypothetical protein